MENKIINGHTLVFTLSGNNSLPWSEAFIEKYADKWDWSCLSGNGKLFNRWTKQEISTALERIRSVH